MDAIFLNGKYAIAFVVRDEARPIHRFESSFFVCESSCEAETLTFDSAFEILEKEKWNNVIWYVETAFVVS